MYGIFLLITLFVSCSFVPHRDDSSKLISNVLDIINSHYVHEITKEQLLESAVNGMVDKLDPHSGYLSNGDLQAMYDHTRGEFGGVGIELIMERGVIRVIAPIDDTPAFRAGIKAGDYINHIEGVPVSGMTFLDAMSKLRGEIGDELNITVFRDGEDAFLNFSIIREIIKVSSVKFKMRDDGIAYIRLSVFSEKTTDELRNAVLNLLSSEDNIKGFVLDLRNNPGGLLEQAVGVARLFIKNGEIVNTQGRAKSSLKHYNAKGEDITNGIPIAVLINGGSASAAEIVAGALQDNHRAVILGTRSFGKGSVQTIIPLPEEKGAIRLTTALYHTASGRTIQAEGITPDIELYDVAVDYKRCRSSFGETSLPNYLDPTSVYSTLPEKDKEDKQIDSAIDQDYPLLVAAQILRGIALYNRRFD